MSDHDTPARSDRESREARARSRRRQERDRERERERERAREAEREERHRERDRERERERRRIAAALTAANERMSSGTTTRVGTGTTTTATAVEEANTAQRSRRMSATARAAAMAAGAEEERRERRERRKSVRERGDQPAAAVAPEAPVAVGREPSRRVEREPSRRVEREPSRRVEREKSRRERSRVPEPEPEPEPQPEPERERDRDLDRRKSRREQRRAEETVRLVAQEELARRATARAQAQQRSKSKREKSAGGGATSGEERTGGEGRSRSQRHSTSRDPQREKSRREKGSAGAAAGGVDVGVALYDPAIIMDHTHYGQATGGYPPGAWPGQPGGDEYDRRQEEMRSRKQKTYMAVPQDPVPIMVAAPAAAWGGGRQLYDGTGDVEKGSADTAEGAVLLEKDGKRMSTSSGKGTSGGTKRKKGWALCGVTCNPCVWITIAVAILLIIIIIAVVVAVVGKNKKGDDTNGDGGTGKNGDEGGLGGIDKTSIPLEMRGTYYDPFDWLDTKGFNVTYTDRKVGGLPVMGLFDKYDDSAQPNSNVPALNKPFEYGKQPMRGVNVGGWFILEPFITPSFFREWDSKLGVVDEWTLTKQLGKEQARKVLEKHYSTFIVEDDFKQMRDAGLDHVRIPFGYWAVMEIAGDNFVYQVSWRYLLRAIEWCRKYGLRVKLDLHSVPGGANGWNHSGRLGPINWLSGPDGDKNGELTLQIHDALSQFFSQPRYKNLITLYGLVNEPRMTYLDPDTVIEWSKDAYAIIRKNGYTGRVVFGDGFRGLEKWKGAFAGLSDMVLDVHQYVIFNTGQIAQTHTTKVQFACKGWANQLKESMDTKTGYGPTMVGEWGQADTDCTPYVNNVGVGTRWEGTLNYGDNEPGNVLTPSCPNKNACSCDKANEHPDLYSKEYKLFLKYFAIAQMDAFENGLGWMYWTWQTEESYQWSYKKAMAVGIMPKDAVHREWSCEGEIPDFAALGLSESY